MSYTFNQLWNEVLNYGFATSYTSRIQAWLNEAQHRVARRIEIRELLSTQTITTAGGTASYALPTDFARLRSVTLMDSQIALDPITFEFFDLMPSPLAGTPSVYMLDEHGLNLYPTPDNAYTVRVRYFRDPVDMVSDADVPSIPAAYQDVLISYAVMRGYRAEDDAQMAQFYLAEYNRGLAELGTDRQYELDDSPRRVAGTWGQRHPSTPGMFS